MKVYIYALVDPRDNIIRYIGQTENPESRLYGHITESLNNKKRQNNIKIKWVRELLESALEPQMIILEETDSENAKRLETEYIEKNIKTVFNRSQLPKTIKKKMVTIKLPKHIREELRSVNNANKLIIDLILEYFKEEKTEEYNKMIDSLTPAEKVMIFG